jgi:hypothetical protein
MNNQNSNSFKTSALNPIGTGYPAQAVLGFLIVVFLYTIFFSAEYLYRLIHGLNKQKTDLLPFTATSSGKSYVISQDPNVPDSKPIHLSDNERSGIEFSYIFFIYVDPASFRTEEGLLHIFHKGYATQYPLLAPGVYMHANKNTMRVYMNTHATWKKYIDVEDLPVKKWVQVGIVCEKNGLTIFINGNVAKRMNFDNSVPYQNYGDIYIFNDRRQNERGCASMDNQASSNPDMQFNLFGKMSGMISNLFYYNYALSYTEINQHMIEGPSSKTDPLSQDKPQYLTDNWWVSK